MERLTIYDIKRLTAETEPYFFSRKTLKFFGQTLKDFSVYKIDSEHYKIKAVMKDRLSNNRFMGYTERIFNLKTKKLEKV